MEFDQNNIITCEWRQLMLNTKGEENINDTFHHSSTIYCHCHRHPSPTSMLSKPALVVFYTHVLWLPTPCPALLQPFFGTEPWGRNLLWKPLGQNGTDWDTCQHFSLPTDSTEWWLREAPLGSHLGRNVWAPLWGTGSQFDIQKSLHVTVRSSASADGPEWWESVNTATEKRGRLGSFQRDQDALCSWANTQ